MPAVQETVARVRSIDVDQYKYGFVTDIESDRAEGPVRGHRPLHLGEEGRAASGCSTGGSRPIGAGGP